MYKCWHILSYLVTEIEHQLRKSTKLKAMKTTLTFAIAMLFSVTLPAAPANLFSAKPNTKTTIETRDITVKSNSTKSNTSNQRKENNPDYKVLEKGKKKLEYQYKLYA
jgi:hypothetical protein